MKEGEIEQAIFDKLAITLLPSFRVLTLRGQYEIPFLITIITTTRNTSFARLCPNLIKSASSPLHHSFPFPDNEIESFSHALQRVKRRVNAKPRRATVSGTGSSGWTCRFAWIVSVFRAHTRFFFLVTAWWRVIAVFKAKDEIRRIFITDNRVLRSDSSRPRSLRPNQNFWTKIESGERINPSRSVCTSRASDKKIKRKNY